MRLLLVVAILTMIGCAKEQEVFDRELFTTCLYTGGEQYNAVYECRRTATTNKEGN